MENRKQGTAVLIQDELAPIAMLKTRGEKPIPERRQSDPSQEHTPERPRSSLRYNTPMTPDYAGRPRAVSHESKASVSPGYESDDRSEDDSPPSVPGPGAVKGGPIYIQRRTSFQRPAPPGRKRTHTPRLPSWHATSRGLVQTITTSLCSIAHFTRTVDCSENTDSTNFKLFLDSNKEIVRAWLVLDDEDIKRNPVLGEKVDCMHAILAAWSIGDEVNSGPNWLIQALELAELNREFAVVWEGVVGVEIEKFGSVNQGEIKEELDIFTSPSELAADLESNVEPPKVETIKVESVEVKEEEMSPTESVTDEESKFEDAEDESTSPSKPAASTKVEEQQDVPTSPTEPATDDEPSKHETMEFIHPDYCAPLFPTKDCVDGSGSGGKIPVVDAPSPSKDGDNCSSVDLNSPKASHEHEHDTISSTILERLDRIEALLQQQSKSDQDPSLEKIENLKNLVVRRSTSQDSTAREHLRAIKSHVDQSASTTTDRIEIALKTGFDKIESERPKHQQQKSTKQNFSSETFGTVLDQHLKKAETSFVKKLDTVQASVDNLSNKHSTTATAFLNELTKLNSTPPSPPLPEKSNTSSDDLEKQLSQLNEGISLVDRGTMIQQVHLTIFRDWQSLNLEQKRSAVSLMKKLISDWYEKYRIKVSLIQKVVADPEIMSKPQAVVEEVIATTTKFKETAEKWEADMDLIKECVDLYDESVTVQQELESKVTLLEAKKDELKQAMMNSHWVYTALDEAVDMCWPQGNTESGTDTDTDSELECEEGGLATQLGRKGSGNGGGCVIM